MGSLHGTFTENMTETLAEYARKSGERYDTLYRKLRRRFPSEIWGADSVLLAEHIAALSGKNSAARQKNSASVPTPKNPPARKRLIANKGNGADIKAALEKFWKAYQPQEDTVTAERDPVTVVETLQPLRRSAADVLLVGVVVGHAGLIWYDCGQLWGEPGLIGGGLIFVIALATLLFASDRDLPRTSASALWFMFLVDCAAYWVHFPTFQTHLVSDDVTTALCIFICASSFVALYLYRDSKID